MGDNFAKFGNGIRVGSLASDPSNGKAGDIYYNTTFNKLRFFNGVALVWQNIGTGSGLGQGINFISNGDFEEGVVTPAAPYANPAAATPTTGTGGAPTVTLVINNINPLSGFFDAIFSKGAANLQGQGFSDDFVIDNVRKGQVLQVDFDYAVSANFVTGPGSDIQMFIYDITNAVLIPLDNTSITLSKGHFTARFKSVSTSTNYRLIWHVATTSALPWTFEVDNIQVGVTTPLNVISSSDRQIVTSQVAAANYNLPVGAAAEIDPAFRVTFVAKASAKYRLSIIPDAIQPGNSNRSGTIQIAANSGAPVLVADSAPIATNNTGGGPSNFPAIAQAVYELKAGVSYQFTLFGSTPNSALLPIGTTYWIIDQIEPDQSVLGISLKTMLSNLLANGTRVTGVEPSQYGEYRSMLRATPFIWSDVNGAPSTAPSTASGMRIWVAPGGAAGSDANNNPSRYDIFVGFNKNLAFDFFQTVNHGGPEINTDLRVLNGSFDFGIWKTYNPDTGILTLIGNAHTGQAASFIAEDPITHTEYTDCFFDVEISDNPVGVGGGGMPFWYGYHDQSVTWTRANPAVGDFTASGAPTLVERENNQIGSVVTAAGNLPGITFTPKSASAVYEISAKASYLPAVNNAAVNLRLWDGTKTIDDGAYFTNCNPTNTAGGVLAQHVETKGPYRPGTTSPVTITLQASVSVNVLNLGNGGITSFIEWSIKRIS